MRKRILRRLMLSGVSIVDPTNTYIDANVTIGQDTIILPNTMIAGTTTIGPDCTIGPSTNLNNCSVGERCTIVSSQIVNSVLENGVRVGPFANIRPGSYLCDDVKIGDFVELKNTRLNQSVQVNHLSYLGDTTVGANTNIGAGTITCNFNGFDKNPTTIGENAFIGSHSTLIAPLTIPDGVIVAAGSIIPANTIISENALAIARPETSVKAEWASRYRAAKANRTQK
jgi:bifunctional UDP-N-acetylglucosamine pyrophosphorylase/glucosamine-1-phosphate N-acetyltransferase